MRTRRGEGWGQLPRAIARALAGVNLTRNESKVLWAIVYKTIAFTKEEDRIPGSQLIALTGIERRNMYRAVNSLLKKGIIFKRGSILGVQTDFNKWENVSILTYTDKVCQSRAKSVSILSEKVSILTQSRDLSKRANQEKGLSTQEKKKKREADKRGLKMLKEVLSKGPGSKLRWK